MIRGGAQGGAQGGGGRRRSSVKYQDGEHNSSSISDDGSNMTPHGTGRMNYAGGVEFYEVPPEISYI
jgi:hypothetical protein